MKVILDCFVRQHWKKQPKTTFRLARNRMIQLRNALSQLILVGALAVCSPVTPALTANATTVFPQSMLIDYVRVYQR
jgi:hypothetical protein